MTTESAALLSRRSLRPPPSRPPSAVIRRTISTSDKVVSCAEVKPRTRSRNSGAPLSAATRDRNKRSPNSGKVTGRPLAGGEHYDSGIGEDNVRGSSGDQNA